MIIIFIFRNKIFIDFVLIRSIMFWRALIFSAVIRFWIFTKIEGFKSRLSLYLHTFSSIFKRGFLSIIKSFPSHDWSFGRLCSRGVCNICSRFCVSGCCLLLLLQILGWRDKDGVRIPKDVNHVHQIEKGELQTQFSFSRSWHMPKLVTNKTCLRVQVMDIGHASSPRYLLLDRNPHLHFRLPRWCLQGWSDWVTIQAKPTRMQLPKIALPKITHFLSVYRGTPESAALLSSWDSRTKPKQCAT